MRAWPGNMLRSCYVVQEKIPEGKGKEKETGGEGFSLIVVE